MIVMLTGVKVGSNVSTVGVSVGEKVFVKIIIIVRTKNYLPA